MEVRGKVRVFRRAHESRNGTWYSYSTSVGSKRQDGTWINDFYELSFIKDVKDAVIPDKAVIDIKDGFLGCRAYKDAGGHDVVVSQIVVSQFEVADVQNGGYTALTDNDVPF